MTIHDTFALAHKNSKGAKLYTRLGSSDSVLFCVGQKPHAIREFMAEMDAIGVPCRPLIGMYKGDIERCFVGLYKDMPNFSWWLQHEETYLHLSMEGTATLHYVATGREVLIGPMRIVSREAAEANDNYTYDPLFNKYYVA